MWINLSSRHSWCYVCWRIYHQRAFFWWIVAKDVCFLNYQNTYVVWCFVISRCMSMWNLCGNSKAAASTMHAYNPPTCVSTQQRVAYWIGWMDNIYMRLDWTGLDGGNYLLGLNWMVMSHQLDVSWIWLVGFWMIIHSQEPSPSVLIPK